MLTVTQVARQAGVSPSLVYAWCRERRLPHLRVGTSGRRGQIRIDPADLDAFLKTLKQDAHPLLADG